MKRQLSLVLALVMILGSFSAVFAAEMPVTQVEKANFLKEVKVLEGNMEGNLNLAQDLKRRDALVVLSRLFDVEEEAKATSAEELTFTDLTDEFYNGFIAWALEEGYAKGKVEGVTFDPNGPLTTQAFATMTLRALGYEEDGKDVFAQAYKIAKDLGILEGVEVEEKDTVTRGDMAAMTYNALGVVVKGGTKTLAETLGIKMPEAPAATELTAKVNDTENLKEVVLELSNAKLVELDTLENVNNYKVVNNDIEKVEVQGNDVVITLTDALLENREYKLRVRSIDKAINKEYKFVAKDNTIPVVESVEFFQEKGIKLRTSEPINILDNVRGRTFEIDGKNIAMDVEVYGRDVILRPYRSESFSKDAKELIISGLADFAGFRSAKEVFEIEMIKDEEAPVLVDLILRGDKTVEAVFDKDIAIGSVASYYDRNNLGNISYESGRHNVFSTKAQKTDTNKVLYTFDAEFLRTRTDFTIVDVKNHSNVKMEKTTMVAREILDNIEPEIFSSSLIGKNVPAGTATMRLYFDKDVTGVEVLDANKNAIEGNFNVERHFKLYDRDVELRNISKAEVVSATYAIAGRKDVVDVKMTGLTEWTRTNELDYILEIQDFTDTASRRNKMFRDYVGFKFEGSSAFIIQDVIVEEMRNETQITLKFNKPVDRVIAEDFKNYIFTHVNGARYDVRDLDGKIVTEINGYEVVLILPDFEVKDYVEFRVLDTLKSGAQRLDRVYTHKFGEVFTGMVEKANDLIEDAKAYSTNLNVVAAKDALVALKGDDNYATAGRVKVAAAMAKLEKAMADADKENGTDLVKAIKELNLKLVEAKEAYKTNKDAALATAILGAEAVLANKEATIVEVKAANAALVAALEGKVEVDKAALVAALEKAEVVEVDYTVESFEAFEAALVIAKALPETTQDEVDVKVVAVNDAVALLVEEDLADDELAGEIVAGMYGNVLEVKVDGEVTKVDVNGNTEYVNAVEEGVLRVFDVKTEDVVKVTIDEVVYTVVIK